MRENQGWYHEGLSHEQLVKGLQRYITHMQEIDRDGQRHLPPEKQNLLPPAAIIRRKLDWESGTIDPAIGEYYSTLRYAWDALTYNQYEPGRPPEPLVGATLSDYYQVQMSHGAPEPARITLTDPTQVRMMDALADAAGIEHQMGQTAFSIPEQVQNYLKYQLSAEYQNQRKASAARTRGEEPDSRQHVHHTTENTNTTLPAEHDAFYPSFWDKFVEQSSIVPTGEDPAFWPRKAFLSFEELLENKDYINDKAKHELAIKLTPIQENMRKVRIAYEIAAYSSIRKELWGNEKSFMHGIVEQDLKMDREFRNRDAVELTPAEQALVGRLCETPRYTEDNRTGQRTLQPKIPFDPERRVYNYADIIGPAPRSEPPATRRRQPPQRRK
jgi:hypothetical protein